MFKCVRGTYCTPQNERLEAFAYAIKNAAKIYSNGKTFYICDLVVSLCLFSPSEPFSRSISDIRLFTFRPPIAI